MEAEIGVHSDRDGRQQQAGSRAGGNKAEGRSEHHLARQQCRLRFRRAAARCRHPEDGRHDRSRCHRPHSPSLLLEQKFLPIFRWAGSTHLTEHTREVLLRFEAASHGDIQHTQVGRAQHLFRTLHSLAQDKPVRAFAG